MKRREFIKAAGVGLAASTIAAPAVAQTMPEIKWRLTAGWPKSLDTMYGACEFFAKRLAEVSDNRFQVQVFAGGEIVPGLQVLDAVQKGTVEMGHTSMLTYFGKDPAFTFGTGLPFGLNTRQQEAWLIHGGGNEMLGDLLKNYNCWGVPGGNTTCQMGGWFRKEINTVADLQGLKMRIGGLGGRIIQKLGVVAQQIASGDIYPSLEKGAIDAAEWVGPHDDEKLGFSKVAKFYYYPGWWDGCANQHFLVNMTKWNELPKNYQAMIQACSREAAAWKTSRYDALNPAALRRLLEAGVVLKPFPQEVMEACWRSANEIYSELNKTNPAFKKMYDSMMAYKNDSYTWFQVAELAYDSFQMRMRGKN